MYLHPNIRLINKSGSGWAVVSRDPFDGIPACGLERILGAIGKDLWLFFFESILPVSRLNASISAVILSSSHAMAQLSSGSGEN